MGTVFLLNKKERMKKKARGHQIRQAASRASRFVLLTVAAALVFGMPAFDVFAEGGVNDPSALAQPGGEPAVYQAGERLSDEQERVWFYNMSGGTFGADMILVESNGRFGLIDTGNRYEDTIQGEDGTVYEVTPEEELSCQTEGRNGRDAMIYMIETLGVDHLDFIIATHAHSDHIGGIPEIADLQVRDQAGNTHPLIDSSTLFLYKEYKHISGQEDDLAERPTDSWHNDTFIYQALQAMNRCGAVCVDVSTGMSVSEGDVITADFSGVLQTMQEVSALREVSYESRLADTPYDDRLRFVWQDMTLDLYNLFSARNTRNENINSIVTVVTAGGHKVFLGGDINTSRRAEQKLAATIAEDHGHMDVMKVSHHGYRGSNSKELVDLLQPEVMVNTGYQTEWDVSLSYRSLKYYAGTVYGTVFYESGAAEKMLAVSLAEDAPGIREVTGEGQDMQFVSADGCLQTTVPEDGWSSWIQEMNASNGTLWYYFRDGKPQTGWDRIKGDWYFFQQDGFMTQDEWASDSVGWYYFDTTGRLVMNSWIEKDGEWYFLKEDSYMAADEWAKDKSGWCWMDSSGRITRDQWIQDNGEWYYLKADGYMAANEWAKESGGWMWMGANGKAVRSKWIQDNGEWYYLKADGYMAAGEWAKDSSGWMWMGTNGKAVRSRWIQDGGEWYYLKANGYMAAGEWAKDSGGWMWMGANGKAVRSKWIQDNGNWYYLKENGYMAAGEWAKDSRGWLWMDAGGKAVRSKWIKSGGQWYYLDAGGYMVTGTVSIDGKDYVFDAQGRWVR